MLYSMIMLAMSCNNSGNSDSSEYVDVTPSFEESSAPIAAGKMAVRQADNAQQDADLLDVIQQLIKNGNIRFESKDIEADYELVKSLLPQYKAYIENENQNNSPNQINYDMTIRVPVTFYDSLFEKLSGISARVDNKYSNIQDVTERYYDLKTRIRNQKALEERYLALLNKAYQIKDILEIERNLASVRTQIEQLEGQFRYLDKQVNYSTISLSFYQLLPYTYNASQRDGFFARLLNAMDDGWQGFLSFMVALTSLWPFLMMGVGLVYLIRKLRARRKAKKLS